MKYFLTICLTLGVLTSSSNSAEIDAWTAVGESVSFCGGVGYQYELMKKFHEAGVTFKIVHPDGTVTDYYKEIDQWTCNVKFIRLPAPHNQIYFIHLIFEYKTKKAHEIWHSIVEEVTRVFCLGTRQVPPEGLVTTILPGNVKIDRNCKVDDLTAQREPK